MHTVCNREDDDGGVGTATLALTVWGPQDLKEDAILDLDSSRAGKKYINRRINRTIKFIEWSLAEKLWTDATHLDPKYGGSVFRYEFIAEIHLEILKGYDTTAKSIYESVIYKLVKADELIVRVALSDAENTLVKTPNFQQKVDHELAKAHEYLTKAMGENEDYSKALLNYWKSWKHSQNAMKWANKEILKHHHKYYHHFKCWNWHH